VIASFLLSLFGVTDKSEYVVVHGLRKDFVQADAVMLSQKQRLCKAGLKGLWLTSPLF